MIRKKLLLHDIYITCCTGILTLLLKVPCSFEGYRRCLYPFLEDISWYRYILYNHIGYTNAQGNVR